MAFVKFQKEKPNKSNSSKTIGINTKGRIVFFKPVIEKYFKDANFVELYYDPETKKIGLLPLTEPSLDALKIQGHSTKMIIAKKFLNRFKIAVEDRRYDFKVEDDGMLVVNI